MICRKVILLLTLVCGVVFMPQANADELSDLSQMLNYVEAHFWRGMVSAPASTSRKVLENYADQLQQLATKVQRKRFYKSSRIGNPIEPASKLRVIVYSLGKTPLRRIYTGQVRTHDNEFMKYFKKQQRSRQQNKFSVQEQIGMYEEFIEETRLKNMEKFEQRFGSSNRLSRLQMTHFTKIAENYFGNVSKLRVLIFKLRRQDPAFRSK